MTSGSWFLIPDYDLLPVLDSQSWLLVSGYSFWLLILGYGSWIWLLVLDYFL
jgi:hypothetical protein